MQRSYFNTIFNGAGRLGSAGRKDRFEKTLTASETKKNPAALTTVPTPKNYQVRLAPSSMFSVSNNKCKPHEIKQLKQEKRVPVFYRKAVPTQYKYQDGSTIEVEPMLQTMTTSLKFLE